MPTKATQIDQAVSLVPTLARLAELSRKDPALFCQFVLRDERTGWPIRLAPVHEEWHAILTNHPRVVLWSATELGKTSQVSIGRVLWEIGRNPAIRILVLAAASGQAKKIVKSIKGYIENSVEFRMVFPHIRPDRSEATGMWREDAIVVKRSVIAKDPTVQAVGYGGNILGGRYDLIIVDDYLSGENTVTDKLRQKFYGWLKSTVEGRKTAASRLWFIGNAWDPDDAMHRYASEPFTYSKKFPVRSDLGELAWEEVWPHERIEAEIANRGPIESRRSMFCDPVTDADRKFKLTYILTALAKGDGRELPYALSVVPPGYRTVTGVDLAVSKKDSADETALTTIAIDDRRKIGTQERQVLDVFGGKLSGPEIVTKILEVQHRYNSIVIVESNAAQGYIKQFVNRDSAVPIKAFYTGKNKVDPAFGITSLAIEMSAGKWSFPNWGGVAHGIHAKIHPELKKLINEMLRYDPQSHTGDRLMSCWLAREGARMTANPAGVGKKPRR